MGFSNRVLALWLVLGVPLLALAEHGGPMPDSGDIAGGDGYEAPTFGSGSSGGDADSGGGGIGNGGGETAVYEHLLRQWETDNNSKLAAENFRTPQGAKIVITKRVVTQTTQVAQPPQSFSPPRVSNNDPLAAGNNSPVVVNPNVTVTAPSVTIVANIASNRSTSNEYKKPKEEPKPAVDSRNDRGKEASAMNLLWPQKREPEGQKPAAIINGAPAGKLSGMLDSNGSIRWENVAKRAWNLLTANKAQESEGAAIAAVETPTGIEVPIENVPQDAPGRLVAASYGGSTADSRWVPIAAAGWACAFLLLLWVRKLQKSLKRNRRS